MSFEFSFYKPTELLPEAQARLNSDLSIAFKLGILKIASLLDCSLAIIRWGISFFALLMIRTGQGDNIITWEGS